MTANRKKVLFLAPSLAGGGAERFVTVLLRHLDRERFEPELALLRAEGEYLSDLPSDVPVHNLHRSHVRYALPGIIRLVRNLRPHAVLSTLAHMNLGLVLTKPFLPGSTRIIAREAATASVVIREETRWPRLWGLLYRLLYKRADKVVCLSDAMLAEMRDDFHVPREKLVRIYNPVDEERILELARNGDRPWSGPGPHLVAVGRLCRAKGFDVLLSAMPLVRASLPQAKLCILGDGPLRDELEAQVRDLGLADVVSFAGFQENPWRFIKASDLFVLPSRYEGMSNALIEALVLGTPVVATDCPGAIREIQAFAPEISLVAPDDPHALAQAIITAGNRSRGSHAVRAEALAPFNLRQIVDEYSMLLWD